MLFEISKCCLVLQAGKRRRPASLWATETSHQNDGLLSRKLKWWFSKKQGTRNSQKWWFGEMMVSQISQNSSSKWCIISSNRYCSPEVGVREPFRRPFFAEWSVDHKQQRNRKYGHRAFQKVQRELLTPPELRERSFLSWRCWIFNGFSKDFLQRWTT